MKTPMVGSKPGVHCAGCRYSFEHYGMKASDGYKQDGKIYCSSDCQMERETAALEAAGWNALAEDY